MTLDFELLDSISFFLFMLILYYLSVISRRLGEVLGMNRYYYIYYVGMFFTLLGSVLKALPLAEPEYLSFLGYVFFAVGLTLSLITSIKYWGWLIK